MTDYPIIETVTLTGADNTIESEVLAKLSTEYPFVEWAILFSQTKTGPRYPSLDWVRRLLNVAEQNPDMRLAAHLCGKWVEDAMSGTCLLFQDEDYLALFERVQLNMGKSRLAEAFRSSGMRKTVQDFDRAAIDVIFGGDYSTLPAPIETILDYGVQVLYDASGGRGVQAKEWPSLMHKEIEHGYAGGLGPSNVATEGARIWTVVIDSPCRRVEPESQSDDADEDRPRIWIDMESSLRTKVGDRDYFDPTKCEEVLIAIKPMVV